MRSRAGRDRALRWALESTHEDWLTASSVDAGAAAIGWRRATAAADARSRGRRRDGRGCDAGGEGDSHVAGSGMQRRTDLGEWRSEIWSAQQGASRVSSSFSSQSCAGKRSGWKTGARRPPCACMRACSCGGARSPFAILGPSQLCAARQHRDLDSSPPSPSKAGLLLPHHDHLLTLPSQRHHSGEHRPPVLAVHKPCQTQSWPPGRARSARPRSPLTLQRGSSPSSASRPSAYSPRL